MPPRLSFLIAIALLAPLPPLAPLAASAAPGRMNLLCIMTDDQAAWSVGAYGNKESRTPNMDRLAREGALFANAFTPTPVCSPSRATFLTGRYGSQLGVTDWIDPNEGIAGVGLPKGATTWPGVLRAAGYKTALIGKWHVGDLAENHPTAMGFEHFFGFVGGSNSPMDPVMEVEGKKQKFKGAEPDIETDEAIRYIEANRAGPFSVLITFRAPHLPYGPVPEQDSAVFKDLDPTIPALKGLDAEQVKKWTRDYYASIHSVDRNIGRLLEKLEQLKLDENTIVVFTSDHGYNIGHHYIHTKGNGYWIAGGVPGPTRPNMWETSIRLPLIVRWPGVVKAGTKIDYPVSFIDVFPSFLSALGVPAPADWKHEGTDFTPLLRGLTLPPRPAIFGTYDLHNSGLSYMRMIRTEQWKLVRRAHANGMDELYDLAKDPAETKNVLGAPANSAIRKQLNEQLLEWMKSINDPLVPEFAPRLVRKKKAE